MGLILRAIRWASISFVLVLVLAATAPTPVAAHYPGISLTGWGAATIDGQLSPGEWDQAGRAEFQAAVPLAEGGGTTPATLFVMNDQANLYLALKVSRPSLDGSTSVAFEFDNDHDGAWPEAGDDGLVVNASNYYKPADFHDNYRYPCSGCDPNSGSWSAADTYSGGGILPPGTSDGSDSASNDGQFTYIEIAHPLKSGDLLHDFPKRWADRRVLALPEALQPDVW